MIIKKMFLFGIFSLFFAVSSYALNNPFSNWYSNWYGEKCTQRVNKCLAWAEANCAPGFGGCDGSCVIIGLRPNCFPGQNQIDAGADPGRQVYKQDLVRITHRSKSGSTPSVSVPPPTYFDPPEKDLSAIKNGKYQVMERGRVREVQLTPSQMQEFGLKPVGGQLPPGRMNEPVRPGVEGPVRNYNPTLYE